MKLSAALLLTALVPTPALANYCAAPLSRVNATISGVVNTYYPITADIAAGNTIQIGSPRGAAEDLKVGDILLLWIPQTMQYTAAAQSSAATSFGDGTTGRGWTLLNHSGKFQWLRVAGTGGTTSPIGTVVKAAGSTGNTTVTISNGGGQGVFGQLQITGPIATLRSAQAVRVPQYGNITISGTVTAEPFSHTVTSGSLGPLATGGIVALDVAGTVTFAPGSKIDVSGLGFRGGAGQRFDGAPNFNVALGTASRWYAYSASTSANRLLGGIKGEGGAGTPHRVYSQGATSANLNYTGTGSISSEGYGTTAAGYGRGAPGNAGGGGTDQCPFAANASSSNGTMCRIAGNSAGANHITYAFARLNTGGGGGGGAGDGGAGSDHDYDGDGSITPSGGGLGGKGVSSFSLFENQPPNPFGNHQFAMMGGGGGAGGTNATAQSDQEQSSGGTGGGVVLIRAGRVAGSGSILADGTNAQNVTAVDPDYPTYLTTTGGTQVTGGAGQGNAGGGGGGGGWVLVSARQSSSPSITYSAKGGRGGNSTGGMGAGGGGGGGYVGVSTTLPAVGASAVSGGSAGSVNGAVARATNLTAGLNAVNASAAAAGSNGSTGQFPASGLSVPSVNASSGNEAASSSSVAPGPQCVPLLTKEFSIDGGNNWQSAITTTRNTPFKMRLRIENGNEDNFVSGSTLPQLYEDITLTDTYPTNVVNATPPNVQQSGCGAASISATAGGSTLAIPGSGSIAGQSTCTITVDLKATAVGTHTNTIAAETVSVTQLKQVVGPAAALTLKNYEDVSASVTVPVSVTADKTSVVISDPVNGGTTPKRIPGAVVDYTLTIGNPTASTLGADTMFVTDALPSEVKLFVGDLVGGAPFEFTANGSNLTCTYGGSLGASDCVEFSTNGTDWTYVPTPDGDGADNAVRFIRFKPPGAMAAGSDFVVRYRVILK
jgi:hypothetical protein